MWKKLTSFLPALTLKQSLGVGASVLAGMLYVMYVLMSQTSGSMTLLYKDVDAQEGARIVKKIESLNIPYQWNQETNHILVPKEHSAKARMVLAQSGWTKGIGYEIFDKSQPWGQTQTLYDINLVRALEGELARSITTLQGVQQARLHIVMAKRTPFDRKTQPPSAAILVTMHPGQTLTSSQSHGIRTLVAASIPGLQVDQVSLMDQRGIIHTEDPGTRKADEEIHMAQAIEQLLIPSVGWGNVRVHVTLDRDYDEQTIQQEHYDPEGQVIRSTQSTSAQEHQKDSTQEGATLSHNITRQSTQKPPSSGPSSQQNKNEEIINYEISKTLKTHKKHTGTLKRLSLAVLINAQVIPAETKTETLAHMTRLIKSAVGFQAQRGDTVDLIPLPFHQDTLSPTVPPKSTAKKQGNFYLFMGLIVIALGGALGTLVFFHRKPRPMTQDTPLTSPEKTPTLSAENIPDLIQDDPEKVAKILRLWMYRYEE